MLLNSSRIELYLLQASIEMNISIFTNCVVYLSRIMLDTSVCTVSQKCIRISQIDMLLMDGEL